METVLLCPREREKSEKKKRYGGVYNDDISVRFLSSRIKKYVSYTINTY